MKWQRGYRSNNVDDRRFAAGPRQGGMGAGGFQLLFWLFRRFGIAGVVIGGAALYFLGGFGGSQRTALTSEGSRTQAPGEQETVQFVSFVFDKTQEVWQQVLPDYKAARMTLFRDATRSACGLGEAAMGPFYCPADHRVYIDLSFYDELKQRFGAPGDFAQAYVIAHEVGHHVQNLLGLSDKVHRASGSEQKGASGLSVRLELQADCFAGVFAHSRQDLLETGDVEEALKAASVIGDDALQKQATGKVRPESFTHGSSDQRVRWFRRGYENGDVKACDTFAASSL